MLQERTRNLTVMIVTVVLVLAACSEETVPVADPVQATSSTSSTVHDAGGEELEVAAESVVAAAINQFAAEYPRNVVDVSVVRIPGRLDPAAVAAALDPPREVVTAPVGTGPFWEVLRVTEESDYWQVDMAWADGIDYFSGSLFFRVDDMGVARRVNPSDVGVTPTTSAS